VTDRGRVDRDENASSMPVAELLAAHKRIRQVEPESEILVGALLRRERALSPDGPADHAAQRTGSRRRSVPLLLGLASAAAVLAGALVTTHLITGYEPLPGSAGNVPENIIAPKVSRPGVIPGSGNDGTTAADQDSSAEDGAGGGGGNDAGTGTVAPQPTSHAGAAAHSPTRQNPPAPIRPPAPSPPVTPTPAQPTKPQPTATPTATTTTSTTAG
jgi:hypothetical protein